MTSAMYSKVNGAWKQVYPHVPNFNAATGGTITDVPNYNGTGETWRVHTFTSNGTFTVTSGERSFSYLLAGAGGGGGSGDGTDRGGGGGGGGVLQGTVSLSPSSYPVVIGQGAVLANGGNSTFNGLTAIGGGRGGNNGANGSAGGCGGGAGGDRLSGARTGGAGTAGQGYAGGNRNNATSTGAAGGSSGATVADNVSARDETRAINSSISGTATAYGVGGRGGASGSAGGDVARDYVGDGSGGANTANTARGGHGVVVVAYRIA